MFKARVLALLGEVIRAALDKGFTPEEIRATIEANLPE